MQITEDLQRSYRQQESELMDAAGAYVGSYLKAMQRIEPNASVAQIREATKVAIEDSLNIFGTQAAELAQGFFDQIAKGEDLEVSSKTYDVIDPELMDKKLHYFAGKLVNGDHFGFRKSVTDLTRYYVKRTAFENVRRNCQDNEIRYARVPSGRETCAFCFMLSSRGFVYHSEKTARGQSTHGMHQHCDCIIVPGVEGVTKIEGYDPDLMYERWKQCAETVGIDPVAKSEDKRRAIMAELATRDWKWLYSGKEPAITFASNSLKNEIESKRPEEIRTSERLKKHGIKPSFIHDEEHYHDSKTGLQQTVGLSDYANKYEIKTLLSASKESSIDRHLRRTAKKKRVDAVVFDNYENSGMSDRDLVKYIQENTRFNGRIYILTHNEELKRIK